ncbi:MAG: TerB family tellurite resistance protein, partial [Candidatus Methanomethylophilaceae archaeon]|nr:TerB family tellurite resistance protein [Candidatus Methanomethylophilaceae archaeon]
AFKAVRKDAKDDRVIIDYMVDILGEVSPELKADIIIITMLVCAVDGKISYKEKKWIKQLLE